MLIFLSIIQFFLCISLVLLILFFKPEAARIAAFSNNSSKMKVRMRPISKIILILVIMFFTNSIILGKKFNSLAKKNIIEITDERKTKTPIN